MRLLRRLIGVLVFLALFWLAVAVVRLRSGESWASILENPFGVFP